MFITAVLISGFNKIVKDFFEKIVLMGWFVSSRDWHLKRECSFLCHPDVSKTSPVLLQVLAVGSWGRASCQSFSSPLAGLTATVTRLTARGLSRLPIPRWSSASSPWTLSLTEHAAMINSWYEMVRNIKNKTKQLNKNATKFPPDTYVVTCSQNHTWNFPGVMVKEDIKF